MILVRQSEQNALVMWTMVLNLGMLDGERSPVLQAAGRAGVHISGFNENLT